MTRKQRTFIAVAAALLTLGIVWSTAVAAPMRPPRQTDTEQRSRPEATPTPECFNRMAGTCGREWTDHGWDRRQLVPTPSRRR